MREWVEELVARARAEGVDLTGGAVTAEEASRWLALHTPPVRMVGSSASSRC